MLVTILTDGEENVLKEFSGNDNKRLVEELKLNRWTFTYIGTEHDLEKRTITQSINNTMVFEKNETGIKHMFMHEQKARAKYSQKIRSKKDTSSNYFDDSEDNKV